MASLNRIAFVFEEFAAPSPAQQLLDRFLMGYPRDGEFRRFPGLTASVHIVREEHRSALGRRTTDFKVALKPDVRAPLEGADAAVVVPGGGDGIVPNETLVGAVLEGVAPGTACFVHGALAQSEAAARRLHEIAARKRVAMLAGSAMAVTWRLPDWRLPAGARLKEALVVVQGSQPAAEWQGLEGLLAVIGDRRGGKAEFSGARRLDGDVVWAAGARGEWSKELLAAALSRSDSPQGDPVVDGRTQDLAGLGLVEKLATKPRAWLLEHRDGLRSSILVLDGVVADFNLAIRPTRGPLLSAQLYRGVKPVEQHFSLLVGAVDEFLTAARRPWSQEREVILSGACGKFLEQP